MYSFFHFSCLYLEEKSEIVFICWSVSCSTSKAPDNQYSQDDTDDFGSDEYRENQESSRVKPDSPVNYQTYLHKTARSRWSKQDTELFYEVNVWTFSPDDVSLNIDSAWTWRYIWPNSSTLGNSRVWERSLDGATTVSQQVASTVEAKIQVGRKKASIEA